MVDFYILWSKYVGKSVLPTFCTSDVFLAHYVSVMASLDPAPVMKGT